MILVIMPWLCVDHMIQEVVWRMGFSYSDPLAIQTHNSKSYTTTYYRAVELQTSRYDLQSRVKWLGSQLEESVLTHLSNHTVFSYDKLETMQPMCASLYQQIVSK